jgi:hypothetical protein
VQREIELTAAAWAALSAHMRAHKSDCPLSNRIDPKIAYKGPKETVSIVFEDNEIETLIKARKGMLKGLGDLADKLRLKDNFNFEAGAK